MERYNDMVDWRICGTIVILALDMVDMEIYGQIYGYVEVSGVACTGFATFASFFAEVAQTNHRQCFGKCVVW